MLEFGDGSLLSCVMNIIYLRNAVNHICSEVRFRLGVGGVEDFAAGQNCAS